MKEQLYRHSEDKIRRTRDRRALIWRTEEEQKANAGNSSLEIGAADDVFEQHADEVAKKVVSGKNASDLIRDQPAASATSLQTKNEDDVPQITEQFRSDLNNSKGSGLHLNETIQSEMSSKMGADLSNVKVHTDSKAHEMSETINAKAFTYGQDIYFKQGNFDTSSSSGKELLAHELTHTQQQKSGLSRKIRRAEGEDLLGKTKHIKGVNKDPVNDKPESSSLLANLANPVKGYTARKKQKNKADFEPDLERKLNEKLDNYAARGKSKIEIPDLENIATAGSQQVMNWMGNYRGVDPNAILFKTTESITGKANLIAFDQLEKPNLKEIIQNVNYFGAFISPEYKGIIPDYTNNPEYADTIDKVAKTLRKQDKVIYLTEIFAGLTDAHGMMKLRRLPYTSAEVIERSIEGYPITMDQLNILAAAVESLMATEPDKELYSDLLEFLDSEHRRRVFARTSGAAAAEKERKDWQAVSGNKKELEHEQVNVTDERLKTDTGMGEGRAFDNVFATLMNNPAQLDAAKLSEAIKPEFKSAVDSMIKTSKEEFISIPSAEQGQAATSITVEDIMQRYGIFLTVLHEFLHYAVHPNFMAQISDPTFPAEKARILNEGMLDVFALEVWNELKPKLTSQSEDIIDLRSKIEGWAGLRKSDYKFKQPPLQLAYLPVFHTYDQAYAAKELMNVVGLDTLKAAYFLGHTELIGLAGLASKDYNEKRDTYEKQRNKHREKKENPAPDSEPYLFPEAEGASEFANTLYQVAFERGMYTMLEGQQADAIWLQKISQVKAAQDKEKNKNKKAELGSQPEQLQKYKDAQNAVPETKAAYEKAKFDANVMAPLVDTKNDQVKELQTQYNIESDVLQLLKIRSENFPTMNDKEWLDKDVEEQQRKVDELFGKLTEAQASYDKINQQYQQLVGENTQKAWEAYLKAKEDLETESGRPPVEKNYIHNGHQTYVLRDPGHVVMLEDNTVVNLANENKVSLEKNNWETWFKKLPGGSILDKVKGKTLT